MVVVLAVLAYALVAAATLATIHAAAKLFNFLRDHDPERDKGKSPVKEEEGFDYQRFPHDSPSPPRIQPLEIIEEEKKPAPTYQRPPSPHPPTPPPMGFGSTDSIRSGSKMSLVDVIKKKMELELSDVGAGSKWRGWQEIRRDEAARRSVSSMYQKNLKGVMSIADINVEGKYIIVANTSGLRARSENLSGWRLVRRVDDLEMTYTFPNHTFIKANTTIKVWGGVFGEEAGEGELVVEGVSNWGVGEGSETFLLNSKGDVQASVYYTTERLDMEETSTI